MTVIETVSSETARETVNPEIAVETAIQEMVTEPAAKAAARMKEGFAWARGRHRLKLLQDEETEAGPGSAAAYNYRTLEENSRGTSCKRRQVNQSRQHFQGQMAMALGDGTQDSD